MGRFLVLLAIAGCHPYVAGGVDSSWRVHGPLASAVGETVTARRVSTAADSPAPAGNSYAIEVGSKFRNFTLGLGLQAHDVTSASFSLPSSQQAIGAPHFLDATSSLDIRWSWLKLRYFTANIHVGPAYAMLLDRTTADASWAPGYRYGAGFAVAVGVFGVFLDAYKTGVVFSDGPARGYSELTGVTLGLALNR